MVSRRQNTIYILILCILLCFLGGSLAFGESRIPNGPSEWKYLLSVSGDLLFPQTKADQMSGVAYGRKYNHAVAASLSLGMRVFSGLFLAARYERWFATQDYTLDADGTNIINELNYQGMGAQVGWFSGSPRVFWLLTAAAYYPLQLKVTQRGTGLTFEKKPVPFSYEGRVELGVRFNNRFVLLLQGGYRFLSLGDMKSDNTSFLPNGEVFDLSSLFGGLGLGLTF